MAVSLSGLIPEFRERLSLLLQEASGKLTLNNGYRSRAEQQHLYDLFVAGKGNPANKPGTSKHETGEAADINGNTTLLAQLAKKYGFYQPHPKELWHIELDPRRLPTTLKEASKLINGTAVSILPTPAGYYIVASDGGVFAYGDAQFLGSMAGKELAQPITDAALSPSGKGYYLLGGDGGVFCFGDAQFHGTPTKP